VQLFFRKDVKTPGQTSTSEEDNIQNEEIKKGVVDEIPRNL